MAFVYILKSQKTGRYYIGSSSNVQQRLQKHNAGLVPATKNFIPYKLMFFRKYSDMAEARGVEARVKRLKRRDYIEKIIRNKEIKFRAISSSGSDISIRIESRSPDFCMAECRDR